MYKVLIVEDDPMVAMINEQYVTRHKDFEVVGKCADGNAALEFLERQSVDLIVLDVFMPYIDGFELLRRIRERQISAEVIMVTAADERDSLREALHLGVVDYLVKPFTFERFRLALDKFIAQSDAFTGPERVNQTNIDFLIDKSRNHIDGIYPKGIQAGTLQLILKFLTAHADVWHTGDEIAEHTGLTAVTVRRYMSYLADKGQVRAEMNYSTGGRPSVRYKFN